MPTHSRRRLAGGGLAASVVVGLLLGSLLTATPQAQTLSAQVLQLLTRINTWTARNTFLDLRLRAGVPSDTSLRFYTNSSGDLFFNGNLVAGSGGALGPHNILSVSHPDTLPAAVLRGSIVIGNSTPVWARLPIGAAGTMLRSDGTDVSWSGDGSALTALSAPNLTGALPALDGSALLALNATNLTSGTVPLARLSAISFTQWGNSGCAAGDAPVFTGAVWACTAVGLGSGSVTSVALTAPAIFSVAGTPITTTGTLAITLATEAANLVWAGPTVGAAATPTFRALVNADLPLTGVVAATYGRVTVNTAGVVTAATGPTVLTTDVSGILPMANGGTGVAVSADDTLLIGSGVAWVAQTVPNCVSPSALGYTQATNLFNCVTTGGPPHNLLSATHPDTLAATPPVRGSIIVANASPVWAEKAVGTIGQLLTTDGVDTSWGSTIARGTVLTSQPWIWTQTWNDGAVTFTGVRVNITSTASAAASLLQDWQVAGTTVTNIHKDGGIQQTGVAFASLGTPGNGTILFCTNCDPASTPCTTGGASTGSLAVRQNAAWKCF